MFFFLLKYSIPLHPVCFFSFRYPCPLWIPLQGKQFRKWTIKALKTPVFQSPAYFQKSKLYFSKSKPYFFESKVSFFSAPFIPKMNSAIIPVPFGHNPVLRFRVFRHPPPFKPQPSGRKTCFSKKTWHTYNVRVRVRAWWTTPWSPREPCPFTPNN